jgi:hypothetical protein
MVWLFRRRAVGALLLFLALPCRPCHAQATAPAQDAQTIARRKGEEALKLYGADRWEEARRLLREADKLYHAPTLVLYIARCERKLGKLLEARATYERLVSEILPPNNHKAFLEAQEAAKEELEKLRPRIPVVKIVVKGVPPQSAKVAIDGSPVSVIEGNMTELNPGTHRIEATVEGANPFIRYFSVSEGGTKDLVLELRKSTQKAPPPPPTGAEEGTKGPLAPGGVVLGLGLAGVVGGAITGALSLIQVADLKIRCEGNRCPVEDKDTASSAGLLGDVSTAAFIAGGIGVAAGVTLVIVRPGGGASSAGQSRIQARIAPFGVHLEGTF